MSEDKINVKEIITFFGMLIIGWILLSYSSVVLGLSKFTNGLENLALLLMVLGIIFIIIGLMYLMVLITKKVRRLKKENN